MSADAGSVSRRARGLGAAVLGLTERLGARLETARGSVVLLAAAGAVYALASVAWPVGPGRDVNDYLGYYLDLWHRHPVLPTLMLYRTPVAPLVLGLPMQVGGPDLLEVALGVLYALSVLAWTRVALLFGRTAGLVTALALLAYPGYALLFHEVSSDSVFAAALALWTLACFRATSRPTTAAFALLGVYGGLLVLTRPPNAPFLLAGFAPLLLRSEAWRARLRWTGAALGASAVLLAGWALHNRLHYGELTVSHGGESVALYWPTFGQGLAVPSNGPASRALFAGVQRDLLPREPYRAYRVDLPTFIRFESSSELYTDLGYESFRIWGWSRSSRKLLDVALEAAKKHPGAVARTTGSGLRTVLTQHYGFGAGRRGESLSRDFTGGTVVIAGRRLPKPNGPAPIPRSSVGIWYRPGGGVRVDWSNMFDPQVRFSDPRLQAQYASWNRRKQDWLAKLPPRNGSSWLAAQLNRVSWRFPVPAAWLLVGALAFVLRRPPHRLPMLVALAASAVVLLLTVVGNQPYLAFVMPFVPLFVVFCLGSLLWTRRAVVDAS